MKIIDCRCRPSTMEFVASYQFPPLKALARKWGYPPPQPSAEEEWFKAIDEAGITKVICPGRDMETSAGRGAKQDHDYLAKLAAKRPEQVLPLAGIDPRKGTMALQDIDRCVKELGFKGIHLDIAGILRPNDKIVYPIYQKCVELDLTIMLMLGFYPLQGVRLSYMRPSDVDEVATDFPKLRIVCTHGAWPYANEMFAVALRNDNVYFDQCLNYYLPGMDYVVQTVNSYPPLAEKVVYASAAPLWPVKETLDNFMKMGWKDEVLEKILWDNPVRAFNLRG